MMIQSQMNYEINGLLNDISLEYGHKVRIHATNTIRSSCVVYDRKLPVISFILPIDMYVKMDSQNMTESDFVKIVRDIYHERRHLEQHVYQFTNKFANQDVKDMAKVLHIASVIPEYKKIIYAINPAEIDAELYAWNNVKDYFEKTSLCHDIDFKSALMSDLKRRIDNNFTWFGNKYSKNYDTAVNSLVFNKYKYKSIEIIIDKIPGCPMSKSFRKFVDSNFYMRYVSAKPHEAFNILFDYACSEESLHFLHYPCLKLYSKYVRKMNYGEMAENCLSLSESESSGKCLQDDLQFK